MMVEFYENRYENITLLKKVMAHDRKSNDRKPLGVTLTFEVLT